MIPGENIIDCIINDPLCRHQSLWQKIFSANEFEMTLIIPALEQSYTNIDGLPIHVCKSYTDKGIY